MASEAARLREMVRAREEEIERLREAARNMLHVCFAGSRPGIPDRGNDAALMQAAQKLKGALDGGGDSQ
jgi:hypothetical protein